MDFTALSQPAAGVVDMQARPITDQEHCPSPTPFQRTCMAQGSDLKECPSEEVAAQHRILHGANIGYMKNPICKSELYPALTGGYTIAESVRIFEDMLDFAHEHRA
jgi:hypothetical protein